jgi:hypothetical protein
MRGIALCIALIGVLLSAIPFRAAGDDSVAAPVSQIPQSVVAPDLDAGAPAGTVGIDASLLTSSNFKPLESADHAAEASLVVVPNVRLSRVARLSVRGAVTKNLENEQEWKIQDTRVAIGRDPIALNPYLQLAPAVGGVAPTSEESRKGASLIAGGYAQSLVSGDLAGIGLGRLEPSYRLRATKNFHEMTTAFSGEANTSFSLEHRASLDLRLAPKLRIGAMFLYATGWTYAATPKSNFELDQSLTYEPSDALGISVGHNNAGTSFKDNGRDSNIAVFNENDSTLYVSLTFKQ